MFRRLCILPAPASHVTKRDSGGQTTTSLSHQYSAAEGTSSAAVVGALAPNEASAFTDALYQFSHSTETLIMAENIEFQMAVPLWSPVRKISGANASQ